MLTLTGGPSGTDRLLFTACGRGLVAVAVGRPAVGWTLGTAGGPRRLPGGICPLAVAAPAGGSGLLLADREFVWHVEPACDGWQVEKVADLPADVLFLHALVGWAGGAAAGVVCPGFAGWAGFTWPGPGGWEARFADGAPGPGAAVLPDGERFATCLFNDGLTVRRLGDGAEVLELPGTLPPGAMNLFALPDGRLVAVGRERRLAVWDANAPDRPPTGLRLRGRGDLVGAAVSPDGRTLAVVGRTPAVERFDAATGQPAGTLTVGRGRLSAVAYSPDGLLLAVADGTGVVTLFDVGT